MDHYYNSRDAGVSLPKPAPKLQPYFARLICTMEERAFPNWLGVTTDLLRCVDFDEQRKLDRMLAELKSNVERNWRDPDHECSVMITPPENRETVIVFYAYPDKLADRRKDIAQILASNALDMSERRRCIVISRNTDRWNDPYSFVLIANGSEMSRNPER